MNEEQLNALRKALNLPVTADAVTIISTANAALQLTTTNATLTTANATLAGEKADGERKLREKDQELTTANAAKEAAETKVTDVTTANAALTSHNEVLVTGALNLAEKRGAISPAEREKFKTRLSTANTAADTLTELQTRKALNTQPVEINGSRIDLSTANARGQALDAAVAKHQAEHKCDYDTAFAAIRTDPNFAPLFGAMQDPTKSAAA